MLAGHLFWQICSNVTFGGFAFGQVFVIWCVYSLLSTSLLLHCLSTNVQSYSKLIAKSPADLEVARDKLAQLHRSLKRSGVPTALLTEVDLALQLIHHRLQS